uniref:Uncharacterized protein n=1 Tax=Rhizophora mucronata TaxID=61149 RepID=A0A2P2QD96_RHIMU
MSPTKDKNTTDQSSGPKMYIKNHAATDNVNQVAQTDGPISNIAQECVLYIRAWGEGQVECCENIKVKNNK